MAIPFLKQNVSTGATASSSIPMLKSNLPKNYKPIYKIKTAEELEEERRRGAEQAPVEEAQPGLLSRMVSGAKKLAGYAITPPVNPLERYIPIVGPAKSIAGIIKKPKETATEIKEQAVDIARMLPRGVYRAGMELGRGLGTQTENEYKPVTKTEKFLLGEEPVRGFAGYGEDTMRVLEALGIKNASKNKFVNTTVGIGMTALDILPFLYGGEKSAAKSIAKTATEKGVIKILGREATKFSENEIKTLATEKNTKIISTMLKNKATAVGTAEEAGFAAKPLGVIPEVKPAIPGVPKPPVEVLPPKGIRPPITPKKAQMGIQPSVAGAGKGIVEPTIKEKLGAVKTYKEQVGLVTEALNAGDMGAAKSLYAGIIKSKYLPKFEEIVANAKQQKFAGGLTEQMTAQAAKQQSLKTERELFDSTIGAENVDNIKRLLKSKVAQDPDFDVTKIKGFDGLAELIRVEKNDMDLTDTEVLDMIEKLPTHAEIKAAAPIEIKPPKELEIIEPEKAEGMIKTLEEGGEVTKVPATQLPVGEGAEKVSRLEARMKGLLGKVAPEERAGLSTYSQMNKPEQITKAAQFVTDNPKEAMKILEGKKAPPEGLLNNSIALAMQEKAVADGDADLARKLASLRSTRAGQEISILTEANKNNPVRHIDDLIQRRIEAMGGKEKIKVARVKPTTELKEVIKKSTPGRQSWAEFIQSIKC